MRNLLLPLLYAASITSVKCAVSRSAPNSKPNEYDVYLNTTLGHGHDQDPRFKLESHYTTERLPATAALMNTVTLLSEAADINFHDVVDFDKAEISEDYPAVVIDLKTAKAKDQLPACFWVWALYGAASDMIINGKFFVSEHDLMWRGRIVARLRYEKAAPNGDDSNIERFTPSATATTYMEGDTPTFDITLPLESSALVSTESEVNLAAPDQLMMHTQYLKDAQDLPIWTLFMVVLATLKDNAEYPASARVRPFIVTVPGFDASMEISLNGGAPRKRPPFFENTHVNQAMRLVPAVLLGQRRVAEVKFKLDLNGKELGNGLLRKGAAGSGSVVAVS